VARIESNDQELPFDNIVVYNAKLNTEDKELQFTRILPGISILKNTLSGQAKTAY
jgi:hypothetical protein